MHYNRKAFPWNIPFQNKKSLDRLKGNLNRNESQNYKSLKNGINYEILFNVLHNNLGRVKEHRRKKGIHLFVCFIL